MRALLSIRDCLISSLNSRLQVSSSFGHQHPLPLWERTEVRGYHPHPNLLPSREKGLYHVLPEYLMVYSNADKTTGILITLWGIKGY